MCIRDRDKDALAKTKAGAWEYDIVAPLYKCNMTDIMAAIGLAQLHRYEELLAKRYALVEQYHELLEMCIRDRWCRPSQQPWSPQRERWSDHQT